jgi:hypothetical protein
VLALVGGALVLAGCSGSASTGEIMVCSPSVTDRCVPVRWEELPPEDLAGLRRPGTAAGRGLPRAAVPPSGARTVLPRPAAPAAQRAPEGGAGSALRRFTGSYFAVDYPAAWHVEAAEASKGVYLDTTIRSRRDPSTYLRVDVTPRAAVDPASYARRVEAYLLPQPGYERLALRRVTLDGLEAVRWEFRVRESGVLLRKVDVFVADGAGNMIAVLTQSRAARFRAHAPLFDRLRRSLVPGGPQPAQLQAGGTAQ